MLDKPNTYKYRIDIVSIPGHQPEMPDSVKLLLRDAIDLEILLGFLLKSID